MKIVPEKGVLGNAILLYALMVLTAALFYFQFGHMIMIDLFLAFYLWFATKYWIAFGRTITIDKHGVTVSFLGITRTYDWSHFPRIAFYDARHLPEYKSGSREGIEFLAKKMRRPRLMGPSSYCMLVHPFSYVFLSWSEPKKNPNYPVFYYVKKSEIQALLDSLGVSYSGQPDDP